MRQQESKDMLLFVESVFVFFIKLKKFTLYVWTLLSVKQVK